MPAKRRTRRDERRRRLGQNFLTPSVVDRLVSEAGISPGELVVDLGAGSGTLSLALAARGARVIAVEIDEDWAAKLRRDVGRRGVGSVRVVHADVLTWPFPTHPFRAMGNLAFGSTTANLHRLLDRPDLPLIRADLVVQWEVARKRAAVPASTLISTSWAPWWEFQLGRRIPASQFRPVPSVDGGVLRIIRRDPPLLPLGMANAYADFVRHRWPFQVESGRVR